MISIPDSSYRIIRIAGALTVICLNNLCGFNSKDGLI